MQHSESIVEISKALAKFQAEVNDPRKDSANPFFKSKYVALDKLLAAIRPALAANGLSFIQQPGGDGKAVSITTMLMHTSGEYIETDPLVMVAVKNDPQGVGSCITYGRRYALSSILGIAWEEDDDGNEASKHQSPPPRQQPKAKVDPPKIAGISPAGDSPELKSKALHELTSKSKEFGLKGPDMAAFVKWKFGGEATSQTMTLGQISDMTNNMAAWLDDWELDRSIS